MFVVPFFPLGDITYAFVDVSSWKGVGGKLLVRLLCHLPKKDLQLSYEEDSVYPKCANCAFVLVEAQFSVGDFFSAIIQCPYHESL